MEVSLFCFIFVLTTNNQQNKCIMKNVIATLVNNPDYRSNLEEILEIYFQQNPDALQDWQGWLNGDAVETQLVSVYSKVNPAFTAADIEDMMMVIRDDYDLEVLGQGNALQNVIEGVIASYHKVLVRNLGTPDINEWTLEDLLERINFDNATNEHNYTIYDWREGFDETLKRFYEIYQK